MLDKQPREFQVCFFTWLCLDVAYCFDSLQLGYRFVVFHFADHSPEWLHAPPNGFMVVSDHRCTLFGEQAAAICAFVRYMLGCPP